MTERSHYSTHTSWEENVGYSRAIQIGNTIEVSGTVASNENGIVFPGDAASQAAFIFEKIGVALTYFNAGFEHVVRVRIYVTDIEDFEVVTTAYTKYFKEVKPAMTLVEISRLVHSDLKLEVEVTAVI